MRRAVKLMIDRNIVAEAKALGINLSRAVDEGLRIALARLKAEEAQEPRDNAEHGANSRDV